MNVSFPREIIALARKFPRVSPESLAQEIQTVTDYVVERSAYSGDQFNDEGTDLIRLAIYLRVEAEFATDGVKMASLVNASNVFIESYKAGVTV